MELVRTEFVSCVIGCSVRALLHHVQAIPQPCGVVFVLQCHWVLAALEKVEACEDSAFRAAGLGYRCRLRLLAGGSGGSREGWLLDGTEGGGNRELAHGWDLPPEHRASQTSGAEHGGVICRCRVPVMEGRFDWRRGAKRFREKFW